MDVSNSTYTSLEVGERIGLAFIVEVAAASLCATGGAIAYYAFLLCSHNGRRRLSRNHLTLYVFSLFVSDFIQAIGGVMDAVWVDKGHVQEGPYCTAQGAMKQAGDVGVALA